MSRTARIPSETQIYHIMMRGNNRENIFVDKADKGKIIDIIYAKQKADPFTIYAFCIMDNHMHLVIKEGAAAVSVIIKRIGISYARYFNKKYNRVGHVFQDRFKSETINSERQLLAVVRYVHLNPVKAGISELGAYPWSSYKRYFLRPTAADAGIKEILSLISADGAKARNAFYRLHTGERDENFIDIPEIKDITRENVNEIIEEYFDKHGIQRGNLKEKKYRNLCKELILEIKNGSELSVREVASLLGLNREFVRLIILSAEPSP